MVAESPLVVPSLKPHNTQNRQSAARDIASNTLGQLVLRLLGGCAQGQTRTSEFVHLLRSTFGCIPEVDCISAVCAGQSPSVEPECPQLPQLSH